ncbi:MAG: carboxypeptidase regulatory-like domain-containing protein [Verrucomicrobiales bacterium]|nr:carboxypeptidase regulatory-like domain-containing protein [Verrucomicrobiales bacterium]
MPVEFKILDWLFRVGWQSAVLVLLVLLAQRLFRGRLSAGWRHALWLVVVARLLLPVTFTSAFSLLNFVSPPRPPANAVATVPLPSAVENTAVLPPEPAGEAFDLPTVLDEQTAPRTDIVAETALPAVPSALVVPTARPFDRVGFAFWLWLIGMAGFSGLAVWLVIRARRRLAGTRPIVAEEPLAILESCRRAMGLRTRPALAESPGLATPALCGLRRPRILLPDGFANRFSSQELHFVFLHELAHLKRGDLFLNWLMTALQIVHWFNPLIWVAFARMRADRELACDELALAVTGEGQRHAYGETILHLLESVRRPVAIPGLVGILEDRRRLKERLERIAGFRKPSRWSVLAIGLLGVLSVVGLTDPQATAPAETDAEVDTNGTGVDDAWGATASGRVLDADGNPVASAEVLLAAATASGLDRTKQARTDEAGHFVVPVSEEGVWQLLVQAPGWAPEWREFEVGAGKEPVAITLNRGRTIRGRVVDDRGDPVAQADVSLWSWRGIGRSTPGIRFRWSTRSRADGSFTWYRAPRDAIRLFVGKDGYRRSPSEAVPADAGAEVRLLLPRRAPSPPEEVGGETERGPAASHATQALASLTGTVTGLDGGGIVDARLLLTHGEDHQSRVIGETGADGRFELARRTSGPGRLFVQATGWAPQVRNLQPGLGMEPVSIKLTDGRTLRGRVVDDGGQPVQDAEVRVTEWGGVDLLDWTAATDADGRFVWEKAPPDPVRLTASAPGFGAATEAVALGESADVQIRLARDFRLRAQVVDAGTGSAITNAVLFRGWRDYWFRRGAISWDSRWRLFYGGGHFEVTYPPNPTNEVCFAATAPGYLPEIGPVLTSEGTHDYTFKLRRGEGWSGTVVDPAGKPVAGAEVAELGADSVVMGKGFFHGLGGSEHLTRSKEDGSFSLPARVPAPRFVAIHPSLGYGDVSQAELVRSGQIPLRPWGRIEGHLRWKDWVGSHEKVRVDVAEEAEPRPGYSWDDLSTQTDADGRFVLDLVPPGRNRLILEHSLPINIEVNAGEPTIVSPPYGATGLPVTGRALLRPPENRLGEDDGSGDWFLVEATLGERGKRVYVRGWTGEDGRFLFPYVEPGEYDLVVEVFASIDGKDRFGSSGRVPFSVPTDLPPNGELLDLGDVGVVPEGADWAAGGSAVARQASPPRGDPPPTPFDSAGAGPAPGALLISSEDSRLWFTVTFEGRPVPNAEVRFASGDLSTFRPRLSAPGFTDNDGRSFVYPDVKADLVVVTSGDRAAEVRVADLTDGCEIALETQAVVVGTLSIGGKPWGHQRLKFQRRHEAGPRPPGGREAVVRTTDDEGRFRIPAIMAGTVEVWLLTSPLVEIEMPPSSPHGIGLASYRECAQRLTALRLRGGEINDLDLSLAGRRITGRWMLERDPRPVDWFRAEVTLRSRDREEAVSLGGLCGLDGSFLIPYAGPGAYDLVIGLSEATDPESGVGGLTVPVTIPTNLTDGTDPLDLGTVRLRRRSFEQMRPTVRSEETGVSQSTTGTGRESEGTIPRPPPADEAEQDLKVNTAAASQPASSAPSDDGRVWFTVTYEGRPVAGAEVQLARKSRIGDGVKLSAVARTDAEGRMFVYPDANAESVVIRQGNRFVEVPLASLTNHCVIALEAEARLSGTLRIGGSPWPNQHLRIVPRYEAPAPPGEIRPPVQVTTDAEGHFEFPALAAGPAEILLDTPPFATRNPPPKFGGVLHGYGPVSQRLASVNLSHGQPRRLDLWLQGRLVKARVVWEGEAEPPDWMATEVLLVDRSASPWIMARGLPAPDGSILVPYAQPGSYQLILELYRDPSTHELIGGGGPVPVTITPNTADGATPLEMGIIPVKPRPPKGEGNASPTSQGAAVSEEKVVEPLGGIHGGLTLGGQAWTNQSLGLCPAFEPVDNSVHLPSFKWTAETRTDEQGRYHFPEAGRGPWDIWLRTPRSAELPAAIPGRLSPPPVEYPFGRRLARVEIFDDATVETNIHKTGRIITGRAVVANPVRPVDLRASWLTMRIRDSKALEGLTGAWVSKDGFFTIPCLDPGDHELHLAVEGYPAAGPTTTMHAIPVGSADPVVVSVATNLTEGTAPIELGEIPVTLRKPLFVGDRATDFQAKTLEGNPLQLADWLGQPVLLIFGCPNQYNLTRGELARFDAWYLDRPKSERPAVVLLGVGSPEDIDWLRAGGYPWPTIDANARRKFFEQEYEATWTPDFILLNREGRVAARHYRFDEMRPAVERLMKDFSATIAGKEATTVRRESLDFDIFLGFDPPSSWPKEPEYAGGARWRGSRSIGNEKRMLAGKPRAGTPHRRGTPASIGPDGRAG